MKTKKIIKFASFIVLIIVFIFVAVVLVSAIRAYKKNTPINLFGYSYSMVVTGSMEPTILVGDFIFTKNVDFSELKIDDIITFHGTISGVDVIIAHRIVGGDVDSGFKTKGDNPLSNEDPWLITKDNYVAKLIGTTHLFGFGYFLMNTNWTKNVMFLILIIIIIAIIAFNILSIFKAKIEKEKIIAEEEKAKRRAILKEEIRREMMEEKTNVVDN